MDNEQKINALRKRKANILSHRTALDDELKELEATIAKLRKQLANEFLHPLEIGNRLLVTEDFHEAKKDINGDWQRWYPLHAICIISWGILNIETDNPVIIVNGFKAMRSETGISLETARAMRKAYLERIVT